MQSRGRRGGRDCTRYSSCCSSLRWRAVLAFLFLHLGFPCRERLSGVSCVLHEHVQENIVVQSKAFRRLHGGLAELPLRFPEDGAVVHDSVRDHIDEIISWRVSHDCCRSLDGCVHGELLRLFLFACCLLQSGGSCGFLSAGRPSSAALGSALRTATWFLLLFLFLFFCLRRGSRLICRSGRGCRYPLWISGCTGRCIQITDLRVRDERLVARSRGWVAGVHHERGDEGGKGGIFATTVGRCIGNDCGVGGWLSFEVR